MRAALLLLALASPAHAACQGDTAFSCRIGAKTLDVCYWKGMLTYRFGPEGRPELTLTQPLETAAYAPWPGIGRAIWDMVAFQNQGTTYEVWTSFDRLDEAAVLEGGVNVMQGDTLLASLTCDKGTTQTSLDAISDLKAGIGQCWDHAAAEWTRFCD
ncbi:MAG: hypothetical protein ACLGIE_12310 [Alphaproteobacteria bacterium]